MKTLVFTDVKGMVSNQIETLLKQSVMEKGYEANEAVYRSIAKISDSSSATDYYYLDYPRDKKLLLTIQKQTVNYDGEPLEYPRLLIDFN